MKRLRPATHTAMLCDSSKCAGVTKAVPIQARGSTLSSSRVSAWSLLNPGMHWAITALWIATAGARSNCA